MSKLLVFGNSPNDADLPKSRVRKEDAITVSSGWPDLAATSRFLPWASSGRDRRGVGAGA